MRKTRFSFLICALSAFLLAAPGPSPRAESGATEAASTDVPAGNPAPAVGLDQLLKLPGTTKSYEIEETKYGGISRSEWASRFEAVNSNVEVAKGALAATQKELDEAASSSGGWNMAPPGATNPEAGPASYELLQKVRDQKDEVAAAERRRTELTVEASLAGVPEDLYRSGGTAKESAATD